jgi:uncharacterized protein YndB with AHSA1/START domain
MVDVDGSRVYESSPASVWSVVSDPDRLAEWVPTMQQARPVGDAQVHLEGESHGHPYDLTSPLRVEEADRRLQWSGERHQGYAGWLEVVDLGEQAEVRVHLTVPDDRVGASVEAVDEIRRGLDEAFETLGRLVGG